jgi:oxygen-independent coproporphyrinogen III oxidase
MSSNVVSLIQDLETDLIRRFALSGPRYTSYPTADRFLDSFGPEKHIAIAALSQRARGAPLSIYVHIPFCASLCYYCACNKIVTHDRQRGSQYVDLLAREVALHTPHMRDQRHVSQLHFGGGTPTFLSNDDLERLTLVLFEAFVCSPEAEMSIEIDPRTTTARRIEFLGWLGFNRMSIGVQDFDAEVQRAVHRVQPAGLVFDAIAAARESGFKSVNLDLIYGLPRQSVASFDATLDTVIGTGADRIALYNYAHLPARFKPQRRISESDCPDIASRVRIFRLALQRLTEAGYVYIGLDHFAKPSDELAIAFRTGRMQRNFQGYSTQPDCDLLALGISGISKIGATYSQNAKVSKAYEELLDAGVLPVVRGIALSRDDIVRRSIIMALMCEGWFSMSAIEAAHGIDFRSSFSAELAELVPFQHLGLVERDDDVVRVTPRGRLLVRALCMVFDKYLHEALSQAAYSKVA